MTAGPERSTILVADDNAPNRALAMAILESAGYAVTLVENGLEAVEECARQASDLVLLDVMMPRMDGFEACRRIRELPGPVSGVPIVFLTAQNESLAHERAMATGADDFLVKPINRTELLIRVRSLIRISRLQRKLAESARNKQELTDLIVHDLKNPIAGVLANVAYLIGSAQLSDEAWGALHDVSAATETMHRMVLNLLDISRSEDGRLEANLASVDLLAIIEQMRGGMQRRADQEDRAITVESPVHSLAMALDGELLRRVLENLVDNCLKYTPRGTTVAVSVRRTDGGVQIRVMDEGAGVPIGHRDLIFEKYAQIGGAPEAIRSSRGLGLRFCKLAVEAHGGRIWVEDNEPRGSAFVVELPG